MTPEEARKGKVLAKFQHIKCHMIFDIKMDDKFACKYSSVTDGNTTTTPASLTYSSVVSRDSLHMPLLLLPSIILISGHVILETHT